MSRVTVAVLVSVVMLIAPGLARGAEPIKIGVTYDQTGPCADVSIQAARGLAIAIEEINARGGVGGRPFELVVIDGECKVEKSLLNVRRFIQRDNVTAILGPTYTGPSMAAMPVVDKEKVTLLTASGGNPINEIMKPGQKYFLFALSMGIVLQHEHNMNWLKKQGITRVVVMNPANQLGEGSNTWYQHYAPKYGVTIVAMEKYDPASLDLTPQLIKLKALGPQALLTMASGADGAIMVKNFHQLAMTIPLVTSDANVNTLFINSLEGRTERVFAPAPKSAAPVGTLRDNDPMKPKIVAFLNAYEKKYGVKLQSLNWESQGYDSGMIIYEAVKAVGADREKIRDWIENLKGFVGLRTVYSFSPQNHRGYTVDQIFMFEIRDKTWHLVN